MVEVEVGERARVAANRAPAPELSDEQSLQSPVPSGNRLANTALAPQSAPLAFTVEVVNFQPMLPALPQDSGLAGQRWTAELTIRILRHEHMFANGPDVTDAPRRTRTDISRLKRTLL